MKKYFVSSDVHGFFDEWQAALKEQGFELDNPNHIIVVCGDLFDRGEQAVETFNFVRKLEDRLIYIKGNHEDLLFEALEEVYAGETPSYHHYHNGTVSTIAQFACCCVSDLYIPSMVNQKVKDAMHPIIEFIKSKSVDYFELNDKIFVHGWIPTVADWRNATSDEWERARWYNGMKLFNTGIKEENKTIYCGHFHASYGNVRKKYPELSEKEYRRIEYNESEKELFEPFIDDGIVALDACTALTSFVNVVTIVE